MMVNMDIRKPGKDREAYVPAIIPKGEEDFWDDGGDFGSSSNYFF
jgi:hypothetical protein